MLPRAGTPIERVRRATVEPDPFGLRLHDNAPKRETASMTQGGSAAQDNSVAVLKEALGEAQMTVRAYDTKAQIVGVGYILAMGIVGRIENSFVKTDDIDLLRIALAWFIVIVPILLFGFVLYPSRRSATGVADGSSDNVRHLLYVRSNTFRSAADLKQAAQSASLADELAFEVLSVSWLRDLKRQRFLRALFAGGISFALLFFFQALRTVIS
ncbi:MAG: hypothetical protein JXQ99_16025 [Hyphomicrobiaceae bacterium]